MGDRGNIRISQDRNVDDVYLYTHWRGGEIAKVLATGLHKIRGAGRYDAPYLTRVVFNELQGDDRTTIGYGISVGYEVDNDHPIPEVWWDLQGEIRIDYMGGEFNVDTFVEAFG